MQNPTRRFTFAFALPFALAFALPMGGCVEEDEQEPDGPEPVGEAVFAATVAQAANSGCSTLSVKPLSQQIVTQANCIAPGAFTELPKLSNLTLTSTVFPFMQLPARDALVSTLNANKGTGMQVNSMLRTVVQQYLLYHWYLNNQCGIKLAAKPGNSNHETGLAIDIQQYNTWKTPLQSGGFKWYGSNDPVHYDYVGAGAVNQKGVGIKAFQQLWNKNHPNDKISEDGVYGPATEARIKQSPAEGFAVGPSCDPVGTSGPDIHLAIGVAGADDRFADGASAGHPDLFEGETYSVQLEIVNKGAEAAKNVMLGIWVEEPYLVASDYLIETDWQTPGEFKLNDANDHEENPVHGEHLGEQFQLRMNALGVGETKRVTLTVAAERYSIGLVDSPDVRFWVSEIPDHYTQQGFDGESTNVDDAQTFGGGKLQTFVQTDIYSRTRWEWNADMLEGWSPVGQATLAADSDAGVLLLGGEGASPGALGPETSFAADDNGYILMRARRTGGTGSPRLLFTTADDPAFSDAQALALSLPDGDAFQTLRVEAKAHPGWRGTITGLRLDPFAAGPGTVEVDFLRVGDDPDELVEPGDGSGGAGGSDLGASPDDLDPEGSCSCSLPGLSRSSRAAEPGTVPWRTAVFIGLGLGLALARRRGAGRGRVSGPR